MRLMPSRHRLRNADRTSPTASAKSAALSGDKTTSHGGSPDTAIKRSIHGDCGSLVAMLIRTSALAPELAQVALTERAFLYEVWCSIRTMILRGAGSRIGQSQEPRTGGAAWRFAIAARGLSKLGLAVSGRLVAPNIFD